MSQHSDRMYVGHMRGAWRYRIHTCSCLTARGLRLKGVTTGRELGIGPHPALKVGAIVACEGPNSLARSPATGSSDV